MAVLLRLLKCPFYLNCQNARFTYTVKMPVVLRLSKCPFYLDCRNDTASPKLFSPTLGHTDGTLGGGVAKIKDPPSCFT